jgi:hypothetical protein
MHEEWPHYCVFEDDAIFCDDFDSRMMAYWHALPSDWGQAYIGGQHLQPPTPTSSPLVMIASNVNRTHGFFLHAQQYGRIYKHLTDYVDWAKRNGIHVDHRLGQAHTNKLWPTYSPATWLVGQDAGESNINGRNCPLRFWTPTTKPSGTTPSFVAVLGLHRSGSSCLAGVLHTLGVHMGNKLGGYEGRHKGGFEAHGLANLCEMAYRFPTVRRRIPRERLINQLTTWGHARQREAHHRDTMAGGKYPHLCFMIPELREVFGTGLRIISIDRPIEHSINSLVTRSRAATGWLNVTDAECEAVQQALHSSREEGLPAMPKGTVHYVDYYQLLDDPTSTINKVIHFLDLRTSPSEVQAAIEHVDPAFATHRPDTTTSGPHPTPQSGQTEQPPHQQLA